MKTAELIVERAEWDRDRESKSSDGDTVVAVRVGWQETEVQRKVKAAGGEWDRAGRGWRLRGERGEELDLESRVVEGAI